METKDESKEAQVYQEIYNFALQKLQMKIDSKCHLETKCMNILQASAILVALFIGLLDGTKNNLNHCLNYVFYLKIVFYLLILVVIILLLISLDDAISNWFKKGQEGLYQDTITPYSILEKRANDLKSHYENMIYDLTQSIDSLEKIIDSKNRLLKWALRVFIFALFILVVLGVSLT